MNFVPQDMNFVWPSGRIVRSCILIMLNVTQKHCRSFHIKSGFEGVNA